MLKNQKIKILKPFLCITILFLICLIPRLFYPPTSNWEVIDENIYKDNNDETYLYQSDPYYYYKTAKENPQDNLLSLLISNSDINIKYLPFMFIFLTSTTLFLIIYKLINNNIYSLIYSSLYSLHPYVLVTSYVGFVDTNTLIYYFSASILFFVLMRKNYIYSIIGLLIYSTLFYYTWVGWVYIYVIILISLLIHNMIIKNYYRLITIIVITILLTIQYDLINIGIEYLTYNNFISECIKNLYDNFFIIPGVLFSIYLLYKFKNHYKDYNFILLYTYYFITFAVSIFSIRFRAYFYIPFFILLAYFTYQNEYKKYITIILTIIITLWCITFITTTTIYPMMDDTIYDTCDYINNNYNETIIGIWDYGHMYAAYCNNQVMYRGTYDPKESYTKAIYSTDEQLSYTTFNNLNTEYIIILNSKSLTNNNNKENFIYKGLITPEKLVYYTQDKCFANERRKVCVLIKK